MHVLPPSTSLKSAKKRKVESAEETLRIYVPTDVEKASDEIVRVGGFDYEFSQFLNHWKSSSKLRLNKIAKLGPKDKLSPILREYSAYKRPEGATLVSLTSVKIFFLN